MGGAQRGPLSLADGRAGRTCSSEMGGEELRARGWEARTRAHAPRVGQCAMSLHTRPACTAAKSMRTAAPAVPVYRLSRVLEVGGQPAGWFCQSVKGTLSTHRHRAGPGWFCIPARWPAPSSRTMLFPAKTHARSRAASRAAARAPTTSGAAHGNDLTPESTPADAAGDTSRHRGASLTSSPRLVASLSLHRAPSRGPTGGMSIRRVPLALA